MHHATRPRSRPGAKLRCAHARSPPYPTYRDQQPTRRRQTGDSSPPKSCALRREHHRETRTALPSECPQPTVMVQSFLAQSSSARHARSTSVAIPTREYPLLLPGNRGPFVRLNDEPELDLAQSTFPHRQVARGRPAPTNLPQPCVEVAALPYRRCASAESPARALRSS